MTPSPAIYIYGSFVPSTQVRDLVLLTEELGFTGISVPDHIVYAMSYASRYPYTQSGSAPWNEEMEWLDPVALIASMAAQTERLRFVTGVYVLPLRHPLLVAKAMATLQLLSGDRVELGIGVGWLKEEFETVSQDFSTRGRRTDEMIEVLRKLWRGVPVEHHGEFFDFEAVTMQPPPSAPIRILVGGASAAALRRAARLGDGFIAQVGTQEQTVRYLAELERLREEFGRADTPFTVMASAVDASTPAELERVLKLGIDTVRVDPFSLYGRSYGGLSFAERRSALERYAREVLWPVTGQ
ncbi:MAG TPA: TIGR03619 family F420-dependent LLM class oxidoreductase [Solirubrobacteraceae bacterium]|jgi:probable F420-dependent oxidoreductase